MFVCVCVCVCVRAHARVCVSETEKGVNGRIKTPIYK